MHVVVVNPFAAHAARQDVFARLARLTGWDVSVVAARTWKNDYGQTDRLSRGPTFQGQLVGLPVVLNGNIPLHFYRGGLTRALRKLEPEVVYVYHEPYGTATAQVFRVAAHLGVSQVGFHSAQNIDKRYPYPFRRTQQYVIERASFATAVSPTVQEVLRSKGFKGPSRIFNFGIDREFFYPSRDRISSSSRLRLGYIGRLVPEKGLMTALRALHESEGAELVIAGEGPMREALDRTVVELGLTERVRWMGYLPHSRTPDFYREIDLLLVPSLTTESWKEQFGRVVLEAAACGVPSITSDSGELPQVIASLDAGLTFPEGNAPGLAAAITALSPIEVRRSHSARALVQVAKRYDWDVVASCLARAIEAGVASAAA